MKKRIDIEEKVNEIKVELIDEPPPDDEDMVQVLRALHHIGKQTQDVLGFWIMASQISSWLESNSYDLSSIDVGHTLKRCGFKSKRRFSPGVYRWINRALLEQLIEDCNVEERTSVHALSHYNTVKMAVFDAYLNEKNIKDLPYELELIQRATREFNELGEEDAMRWMEQNG